MKNIATMLDELSYKYDNAETWTDTAAAEFEASRDDAALVAALIAIASRAGHITELLEQIVTQLAVSE